MTIINKRSDCYFLLIILLASVVFLLAGCPHATITQVSKELPSAAITNSNLVLIKKFKIDDAIFTGDGADDPKVVDDQKKKIPSWLTEELIKQFAEAKIDAKPYSKEDTKSEALVIDGIITHVNNGSGAARVWWGFGAGAAGIKARVNIYKADSPDNSLAAFNLESTSGGAGGSFGFADYSWRNTKNLATQIVEYMKKNNKR
jgi:hypothetical protein